jgi:hypothetical protein
MAIRTDFTAGEVLAAADLNDTFAAKLNLAGGKILQIVRATDATDRITNSSSYVDASISVTITPQKSDSAVILIWIANTQIETNGDYGQYRITDASDNAISGASNRFIGAAAIGNLFEIDMTLIGYATPATTSAVTYKGRFGRNFGTGFIKLQNATNTGQLYAIEVSA